MNIALLVGVMGCTSKSELQRDTPVTSPATVAASPQPARDSTPSDPWTAQADSALRRLLAHRLFAGGSDAAALSGFRDCGDEGGDNPPMLIVAARSRPIGHDAPKNEASDDGAKVRDVSFRVEVTSVAQLTPAPDAGVGADTLRANAGSNAELYAAVIAPRIDTLEVAIRDYGGSKRWADCGVTGNVRGASSQFWMFVARPAAWAKVVRWTPASGSWDRVHELADSVARAVR